MLTPKVEKQNRFVRAGRCTRYLRAGERQRWRGSARISAAIQILSQPPDEEMSLQTPPGACAHQLLYSSPMFGCGQFEVQYIRNLLFIRVCHLHASACACSTYEKDTAAAEVSERRLADSRPDCGLAPRWYAGFGSHIAVPPSGWSNEWVEPHDAARMHACMRPFRFVSAPKQCHARGCVRRLHPVRSGSCEHPCDEGAPWLMSARRVALSIRLRKKLPSHHPRRIRCIACISGLVLRQVCRTNLRSAYHPAILLQSNKGCGRLAACSVGKLSSTSLVRRLRLALSDEGHRGHRCALQKPLPCLDVSLLCVYHDVMTGAVLCRAQVASHHAISARGAQLGDNALWRDPPRKLFHSQRHRLLQPEPVLPQGSWAAYAEQG